MLNGEEGSKAVNDNNNLRTTRVYNRSSVGTLWKRQPKKSKVQVIN